MKLARIFASLAFIVLVTGSASAGQLYLFGGKDHTVFLGCLTSNRYASNSVWNKYGKYGSKYSSLSIWNAYGTYGSKYSGYSPWNRYGHNAPAIVDDEGNFYGYLSVNRYHASRTKLEFCLFILQNRDWILEHFDWVADNIT